MKDSLPDPYVPLYYLNFLRYPTFFLASLELESLPLGCPGNDGAVPIPQWNMSAAPPSNCMAGPAASAAGCYAFYCPLTSGQQLSNMFDIDYDERWIYLAVTVLTQPVFRMATYFVMKYVTHIKR